MNYTVENAALIGDAQELPYQEFENLQNLSEREEESEGDIWDPLFQEDIFQHDSRLEIEQEPGSESLELDQEARIKIFKMFFIMRIFCWCRHFRNPTT